MSAKIPLLSWSFPLKQCIFKRLFWRMSAAVLFFFTSYIIKGLLFRNACRLEVDWQMCSRKLTFRLPFWSDVSLLRWVSLHAPLSKYWVSLELQITTMKAQLLSHMWTFVLELGRSRATAFFSVDFCIGIGFLLSDGQDSRFWDLWFLAEFQASEK